MVVALLEWIPKMPLNLPQKEAGVVGGSRGASTVKDPRSHQQDVRGLSALHDNKHIGSGIIERLAPEDAPRALTVLEARSALGEPVVTAK